MECTNTLRIFGKYSPINVLGPEERAVIWLQGCNRRCVGCSAPESWEMDGGYEVSVDDLAEWVDIQQNIEGITLSGGEPMLQSENLCRLVDVVTTRRDLGVVCYTGFRMEKLVSAGSDTQRELLGKIDLLIDGAYDAAQHTSLLWRPSANQRLLPLSNRYKEILRKLDSSSDVSAGLQFFEEEAGTVGYAGVPPAAGFHDELINRLSKRNILLVSKKEVSK